MAPINIPEKLIPFFATEAIDDRPLPVYGDGKQIRDWLYVDDHARGVDCVLHHGVAGEAYNLAGENQRYNIDVTRRLLALLGKPESLIRFVPDREGHDRRYAMTAAKARAIGWRRSLQPLRPVWPRPSTGIARTNGGGGNSKPANTAIITSANTPIGWRPRPHEYSRHGRGGQIGRAAWVLG